MRLTLLVMCLSLLLLPWSCGADASVLGRCGGVLSLAVVDSGAVVVDWAFVWCVNGAVSWWWQYVSCKRARARERRDWKGVGVLIHNLPASGLVPSALKVAPLPPSSDALLVP